jgi:hypothetical protein
MQGWHLNCFIKTMSTNRQLLRDPAHITSLHDAIRLTQTALKWIESGGETPLIWDKRKICGFSSMGPHACSIAHIGINGIEARQIQIEHADPMANRRRILFALNEISQQTGVTAHPVTGTQELPVITLRSFTNESVKWHLSTDDPTQYWSATYEPIQYLLGGVLVQGDGGLASQHLPLTKSLRYGLTSDACFEVALPCAHAHMLSPERRRYWALSLRNTLLRITTQLQVRPD